LRSAFVGPSDPDEEPGRAGRDRPCRHGARRNHINIANFSLGRRDAPPAPGEPLEALAVVSTDTPVPERVLVELRTNPAVKLARAVECA